MTCKECLYYEVCKDYLAKCAEYGEAERINNPCTKFKNKADFVEVVRCKDCASAIGQHPLYDEKMCVVHECSVPEDYYCASGKRRDVKDA